MLVFIEAIIGSHLDDSSRSKIYVFHQEDGNASGNYHALIDHDLNLDGRFEILVKCREIQPVDISTDKNCSDEINSRLHKKGSLNL